MNQLTYMHVYKVNLDCQGRSKQGEGGGDRPPGPEPNFLLPTEGKQYYYRLLQIPFFMTACFLK